MAIYVTIQEIEQQSWPNAAQTMRLHVQTNQPVELLHYQGDSLASEEFNNLVDAYGQVRFKPPRAVWEYSNAHRQCCFRVYVERASGRVS